MKLKPITTEKAVMAIETQNELSFEVPRDATKTEIKKTVEEIFNVKVESVRTLIGRGKKHASVKLKKGFLAIDLATKMGLM